MLLLKGFVIGLGKIIPGVSGSMLAINFNIYEKAINAITNFFSNWKGNLKFLIILLLGIMSAIILGSSVILYLLTHYKFVTLLFFTGLITGGTYNFSKKIACSKKNVLIIIITLIIILPLSLLKVNTEYQLKGNYIDCIIFFIAGIIEIFSSLVPGISGTSLLMLMGIYQNILAIISNIFDPAYVIKHLNLYLSYGIGMFISFILNVYLISYLLKKHRTLTYTIILGLSLASIIFMFILAFKTNFNITSFILGIMFMILGLLISFIFAK